MAVSACVSAETPPLPQPTSDLVVFTATPTPLPATPTQTPIPPPSAGELLMTPRAVGESVTGEQQLIDQSRRDLADYLDVTDDAPELILSESVYWRGEVLDCESDLLRLVTEGIAGFRQIFLHDETIYVYRTDAEQVILCNEVPVNEATPDLLVQIDPIAADMVSLVQRRLAQDFDISTRRVRVQDIAIRTWEDASLGCPIEGQTYQPIATNGYRIVVAVADDEYVFHTSFDRVVLCAQAGEGNG